MKKILLAIVGLMLLVVLLVGGLIVLTIVDVKNEPLLKEGTTYTIPFEGEEREFNVHVPPSYVSSNKYPLVLVLHGGGGRWISAKKGSQMNEVSDKYGFIVVYPNSNSNKTWNVGTRGSEGRESDANDILYISTVIDFIESKYQINREKIFVTGLSNGGMMSYNLACNLSNTIKAAAPVSSSLMYHPCEQTRAVPIMAINGILDPVLPYNGGKSAAVADNLRSAPDSIKYFTDKFCPNQPPIVSFQNNDSNCVTYIGCQDTAEFKFCTIANGGHTWPGGKYESGLFFYPWLVGPVSEDMNSAEEIWNFFEKQ